MKGTIFDIQRFCINDGPGIRTTVFLKGCPLDCLWCHNPESKKIKPQLSFKSEKCTGCSKCLEVCKNKVHSMENGVHRVDYEKCTLCGNCVKACNSEALSIYGYERTIEEIIEVVKADKKYYESSGGGMTISGGEPMMQGDFTIELAKRAKEENIHVAVETSGQGNLKNYETLAQYVDLFLFDYKATGSSNHINLVGHDDGIIKKNRETILKMGGKIILRCPIVPNYNLSEEHLKGIGEVYKSSENIVKVEVLPYHPLGESKALSIGEEYKVEELKLLTDKEVDAIIEKLKNHGVKNISKG